MHWSCCYFSMIEEARMGDDAWRMFAELCQVVCENENVMLDVVISEGCVEFMLMPYDEDFEEDDEDE